jgi:hypothetical protein
MKFNYYTLLLMVLVLASCSKELPSVSTPDLEITAPAATFKVNEEITFRFAGSATQIAFYPGTESGEYQYRAGKVLDVAGSGAELSFQTAVVAGAALQNNQLRVLASTTFNGTYDFASLKSATWTDITNRFVLNGTTITFTTSGVKDISDLIVDPAKPIYIAFQYTTQSQAANGLAREHQIQSFLVSSKAAKPAGVTKALTLADQFSAAFKIIDQNPVNAPARALVTATRVTLKGNIYKDLTRKDPASPIWDPNDPIFSPTNPIYVPGNALFNAYAVRPTYVAFDPASSYNDPVSEHWAVSKPIYATKVDLGIDVPVIVKSMTNQQSDRYFYKYTTPGTYKAVFVYANHNIDDTKQLTKEFTITITP